MQVGFATTAETGLAVVVEVVEDVAGVVVVLVVVDEATVEVVGVKGTGGATVPVVVVVVAGAAVVVVVVVVVVAVVVALGMAIRPASTLGLFSPSDRVTGSEIPEVVLTSESVASVPAPAFCVVKM